MKKDSAEPGCPGKEATDFDYRRRGVCSGGCYDETLVKMKTYSVESFLHLLA
jgi:hypothetical protein